MDNREIKILFDEQQIKIMSQAAVKGIVHGLMIGFGIGAVVATLLVSTIAWAICASH